MRNFFSPLGREDKTNFFKTDFAADLSSGEGKNAFQLGWCHNRQSSFNECVSGCACARPRSSGGMEKEREREGGGGRERVGEGQRKREEEVKSEGEKRVA